MNDMRLKIIVSVLSIALLTACGGGTTDVKIPGGTLEGYSGEYAEFLSGVQLSRNSNPVAVIETRKGSIAFELYAAEAPRNTQNFIALVREGFYNGLQFHLVKPGFVIQTGDPSGIGTGGANVTGVPLETHPDLKHDHAGVVGMARLESDLNSATSQFYITLDEQPSLDDKYSVFGDVLKGMEVVDSIVRGDRIEKIVVIGG